MNDMASANAMNHLHFFRNIDSGLFSWSNYNALINRLCRFPILCTVFFFAGPKELQYEIEKIMRNNGESAVARLDGKMKNELREKGSKINKELLLNGLYKPFPKNCISLMTISGAKGSSVSFFCTSIQPFCTSPLPQENL